MTAAIIVMAAILFYLLHKLRVISMDKLMTDLTLIGSERRVDELERQVADLEAEVERLEKLWLDSP